jgi:hypothetical protein
MKKINFEIQLATLLPEFIYQFMLNGHINQDSINCIELEDLRDSIKNVHDHDLDDIRKFLFVENKTEDEEEGHHHEAGDVHNDTADATGGLKSIDASMGAVDEELEEIGSEYFHRYTPVELKYIFDKIIDAIDKIYKYYLDHTELNLILTIGFKFDNELESNLVVEFFQTGFKPETLDDEVYYVPCRNAMVSDDIAVRAYFNTDPDESELYEESFKKVTDLMNVKVEDRYKEGLN